MKRGTFLLLLIGLSFTLAGCYSRYDRYPDYRRGGAYYQSDQVRELADDLEDATDRVYDRAEDYSNRRSDREDYALDRLEDLRDEARDFKNEVEDHRRDPRDTRDDYQDLVEAYYRARDGMRALNAGGDVYREFDRVSRIMAQLNRVYGGQRNQYSYRYR